MLKIVKENEIPGISVEYEGVANEGDMLEVEYIIYVGQEACTDTVRGVIKKIVPGEGFKLIADNDCECWFGLFDPEITDMRKCKKREIIKVWKIDRFSDDGFYMGGYTSNSIDDIIEERKNDICEYELPEFDSEKLEKQLLEMDKKAMRMVGFMVITANEMYLSDYRMLPEFCGY